MEPLNLIALGVFALAWLFYEPLLSAFGKRRKTLRNALSMPGGLQAPLPELDRALAAARIDPGRRAETMTLKEFARLADALAPSSPVRAEDARTVPPPPGGGRRSP